MTNLAKNFNYSNIRIGLGVFCLVAIAVFLTVAGRTLAQTWVEPTQSPPLGNVAAPIWNQNASSQTGTFWINGTGQLDTTLAVGSSPASPSCTGTKLCGVIQNIGAGVYGESTGGFAIYGNATNGGIGVIAKSDASALGGTPGYTGVYALGDAYGVYGQAKYNVSVGPTIGVYGFGSGSSTATGIEGYTNGASGYGVEGYNSGGGYGVYGVSSGYAGYFQGALNATGTITQNGVAVCLSNGTNCGSGGGGGGSITSISGSLPIVVSPTTGAVVVSCPTCLTYPSQVAGYLPRSNGSTALVNSSIFDNGVGVSLGTTTINGRINIVGDASMQNTAYISTATGVSGLSASNTATTYVSGYVPSAISTWAYGNGVYAYNNNSGLGSAIVGETGAIEGGAGQIKGAGVLGYGMSSGTQTYGVYGLGKSNSGTTAYGVVASASASGTGPAVGLSASASTSTGTGYTAYAIYATATNTGYGSPNLYGLYTPNIVYAGGGYQGPWGTIIRIPGYNYQTVLSNNWDGYGGDYVQLNAAGNGNDVGYVRMYGPSGWTVFSGNIDVRGGFELDSTGTRDSTAVRVFDNSGNLYLQYGSGGYTVFRNNAGGWVGYVIGDGFHNGSDERLKKDIVDLGDMNGLAAIDQLRPVTYYWRDEAKGTSQELGFIAQDVQKLFPEAVSNGPDGMLGLNYSALVVPMVKSIQQQQKEIEDLQKQIDDLKAQLNK